MNVHVLACQIRVLLVFTYNYWLAFFNETNEVTGISQSNLVVHETCMFFSTLGISNRFEIMSSLVQTLDEINLVRTM